MNVSIVIATCGDVAWADLAWTRAYPSANVVRPFLGGPRHPQVVIEHYPELTVSQARNAAAAHATGDFLCFLDADDELEPGYIEAMEAALEQNPAGAPLLVPAVRFIRPALPSLHRKIEGLSAIPNRGGWPKTNECVIGTLIRRDLFERVGGFRDHTDDGTELSSIEDYDLWLRCWDAGAQLVYVEDAVYRAYVSQDGGRNRDQSPYAAIWADHERRIKP